MLFPAAPLSQDSTPGGAQAPRKRHRFLDRFRVVVFPGLLLSCRHLTAEGRPRKGRATLWDVFYAGEEATGRQCHPSTELSQHLNNEQQSVQIIACTQRIFAPSSSKHLRLTPRVQPGEIRSTACQSLPQFLPDADLENDE